MIEKDSFRAMAYSKAINSIKSVDGEITSVDDITGLKNIGPKIIEKVQNIIDNGRLDKLNEYRDDPKLKLYNKFKHIYGVGTEIAYKFVYELDIKSLEELYKRREELKLNDNILIGLKYYNDLLERIPRKEMDNHKEIIFKTASKLLKEHNYNIEMVGSYRRNYESCGDIDIIITGKNKIIFELLVKGLQESGYLKETMAFGGQKKKYMGISICKKCKVHRRIDMLFTTPEEYPFAILYFTGSGDFNVKMRQMATKLGYKLSEKNIKNIENNKYTSVDYKFNSEKDIFDFLNIDYLEPEKRVASALKKLI